MTSPGFSAPDSCHHDHRALEVGSLATFSLTVTGTAPLSYQWRFNGGDLPGKTTSNLVLFNVQLTNTGDYTVVITNLAGAVTSQVARLVFPGPHWFQWNHGVGGRKDFTGV
jgi:Immunoglobulin I-set domain